MSGPSFARLAVVQLHFHPAAVLSGRSLLQDPRGSEDELLAMPESLPQLDDDWKSLRKRVAEAYLASFRPKLDAILDACQAWGVNLVVFPEYAIPWQLLQSIARPGMNIVAGTHSVTSQSRKSGVYGELEPPAAGTAVAPVFGGNGLTHLSGKQSPSKEETRGGFKPSPQWGPVELEGSVGAAGPLAVMICIDFINRGTEAYRERVSPQLDQAGLIALPTYTPWHSLDNFSEQARTQAFRQKQPVLWANCAAHGGTTIIVDDDPKAPSSANLPVLGRGEEGVLVVDVDLGTQRRGRRTKFDEQPVVQLVASASLAYQHTTEQQAYARWSDDLAQRAVSDTADLDTLVEWIQANDALLVKTIELEAAPTRSKRLRELRTRLELVSDVEKLRTSTREVVLPPEVLPLPYVQHGLALGAKRLIAQWRDVHRYGLENFESQLDAVVRAQPIENITASTNAAIEEIAQQVTGPFPEAAERPPNDAIMARLVVGESDVDKAFDENKTDELEGELQTKIADLEHILASSSEANDSLLQNLALNRLELARLLLNLQRSGESTPLLEQVDEKHLEPKSIVVFARMWAECGSPERAGALLNRVGEEEHSSHYDQALLAVGLANGELPEEVPDDPTQQIAIASYHLRRGDFAEAARVALLAVPKVGERAQSVLVPYVVLVQALYETVFEAPGRTSEIGVTNRLEVIETLASLRDTHLDTWLGNAAGAGTAKLRAMVVGATAAFHEVIEERETWPRIHREDEDARASDRATDVAKASDLEAALDQMPSAGTQPWIDELRRGKLRMASGDIQGAIRDARALAERYPHRGPIEYFLAALLYNRDDHEGARVHAERAYQQVPGGGFRSLFVICLESTGDVSRAWSLLEPTLEHAGPHALRIAALVAEKAVPQQAAGLWKRYLDAVPEAHNDRVQYARVLFHDGKTGQAAEQARHAVEGSEQSLPAHLLYLAAHLQLNADGSMPPAEKAVPQQAAGLWKRYLD
ncbi:MAG: hypothetical protein KUG77_24135, partial [Nannocystaceae bacterium]|nr:hypothetical protein [Nannocystaceae bacterium]